MPTTKAKRQAIERALSEPTKPKLSDRELARQCGCDHKTVGKIRRKLAGEIPQPAVKRRVPLPASVEHLLRHVTRALNIMPADKRADAAREVRDLAHEFVRKNFG